MLHLLKKTKDPNNIMPGVCLTASPCHLPDCLPPGFFEEGLFNGKNYQEKRSGGSKREGTFGTFAVYNDHPRETNRYR